MRTDNLLIGFSGAVRTDLHKDRNGECPDTCRFSTSERRAIYGDGGESGNNRFVGGCEPT